jgi:L-aspartate oxidase
VHGANRLASNSLLEGMVFAPRVVEAIERGKVDAEATGAMRAVLDGDGGHGGLPLALSPLSPPSHATEVDAPKVRDQLQRAMTTHAGVLRSAQSLADAAAAVDRANVVPVAVREPGPQELRNLVTVASALLASATSRRESRGAHTRTDYPDTLDEFRRRLVIYGS